MRIQVTPETTSQAAAATARTRASAQAVWSRTKRSIDLSHESDVTAPSPADKLGRPGVGDDAADASACKAARKGITPAAGLEAADAVDGGASAGTWPPPVPEEEPWTMTPLPAPGVNSGAIVPTLCA